MAGRNLVVRAGERAKQRLRAEGFHPDLFGTLVGASGGPKWLVLRHLDSVLIDRLLRPRSRPIDTLGSSIGSFRHACFAQDDPHAALARFERGYVEQSYEDEHPDGKGQPSMEEISLESDRILANLLGEKGAAEICANGVIRSHMIASRLMRDRGLDRGAGFKAQVGFAAVRNALSRKQLARSFRRIHFRTDSAPEHPADDRPSRPGPDRLEFEDFSTEAISLTPERVKPALLASGAIPLLMAGVSDIPGIAGTLFDGGIIDYHYDFRFRRQEGLVLFAHFFDRITPGWFDKPLKWRRPHPEDLEDVVMLAPSDEFVARLPGGKVPDRTDFLSLGTEERIIRWRKIIAATEVLAEELERHIEHGTLAEACLPFRA